MRAYKNLEVWNKAMQLVSSIYVLTKKYPKEELFGLTSQTKQAAVSIPANIAEGIGGIIKRIPFSSYISPEAPCINLKRY